MNTLDLTPATETDRCGKEPFKIYITVVVCLAVFLSNFLAGNRYLYQVCDNAFIHENLSGTYG